MAACSFSSRGLPLAAQKFADGAPSLIDGHICVGTCAGIGIGDGDPAERLPANNPGLLLFFPAGIEQRIRRKSVAVRPAVDGDAFDVFRRVETCSTEHAAQLVADAPLEFRKGRLQEFRAPGPVLVALRQSGLAWSSQHEEN